MIATGFLFVVSISLAYGRPEDAQFCGANANVTVVGIDGTFGCNGYANNVLVTFNVSDPSARMLTFLSFNTESCCDKVTISYMGSSLGPFSGQNNPGAFVFGGGDILVVFQSDPSTTYPGFTIQLSALPPMDALKSQQTFSKSIQTGGMTYFMLPGTTSGSTFSVSLSVSSFDGLQSPSLFMSRNRLPSLESYDYLNNTVPVGRNSVASFNLANPPPAQYWLGVFLYGNVAQVSLLANWAYNFQALINGAKVSSSVASSTVYFQLYTPKLTKNLNFQISRQVPGGFPIAYIAQGFIPTATTYQWIMDTTTRSFISLDIPSPNPTVNFNPNPGQYYVALVASNGPTDSTIYEEMEQGAKKDDVLKKLEQKLLAQTAGFILMATWA